MSTIVRHSHACFSLHHGERHVVVDPGSFNLGEIAAFRGCDAVVVSHRHPDHCDAGILSTIAPSAVYAPADVEIPGAIRSRERTIEAQSTFDVGSIRVKAFEVDHGPKLSRPIKNLGFRFEVGSTVFVYLGDIAVAAPMPELSGANVLLVPTGGNGYVFDAEQAATFLRSIAYQGLVVPVHDLGPSDPTGAARLARLVGPDLRVQVLAAGESLRFGDVA